MQKKYSKLLRISEICSTFATAIRKTRAFSSAGLEHLPYKQRVGGSNPSTPTTKSGHFFDCFFCIPTIFRIFALTNGFWLLNTILTMQINNAAFVLSSPDVAQCPPHTLPEYAFIGRSNVGKSSLINMLCRKKDLAKTSSKPGKTLLINHFLINNEWQLVDLPGYGFAKAGKAQREKLRKMIERYCLLRPQLVSMFVLVDCRHEPQAIDLEFMRWLGEQQVPFAIVFTKADKLGRQRLNENIEAYKATLLQDWETLPPCFVTSSDSGLGAEQLLSYIEEINQTL